MPTSSDERKLACGKPLIPPFHPNPQADLPAARGLAAGVAIPATDADFTADLEVNFVPVAACLPEAA